MYIDVVPNRNSPPAVLLREAWRQGNKTCKRTLANLSDWPQEKIETFRRLLRDERLVSPEDLLDTQKTLPHGHVEAVLEMIRALQLERMNTENDLYAAMDWLGERQERIEKKLAARHLQQDGLVLYDVSSSFYEGRTCPLAKFGHDRDGQKGLPIIVYGVMTNGEGCPVAVEVYAGNTGDPTTVADQIEKLRERFGLMHVVLAGDRGMLTQPQINKLKAHPGLGWITALTSVAIRELVTQGALQLSLLDQKNLAEITSPEYPGERLVVCHNPLLEQERKRKREELLAATEKHLEQIRREVERRKKKPLAADQIGVKVGKVLGRYKMGKHFVYEIGGNHFTWKRRPESMEQEAQLDGIYVLRTSEPAERLSAEDTERKARSTSARLL